MRILSRYFALRFTGLFFAILFVSTLAIIVVEMLLNFDEMAVEGRGTVGALTYLFLRIPSYYLRDLIPITTFAAAFFSLGLAGHWFELTAARAGGTSTARLIAPILVTALSLAGATFVVNETLVVDATQIWNQHHEGDHSISFRRGTFWYHRGRTIYNIASANRADQTLRDVTIYELSPRGRLLRRVHAEFADISGDPTWTLEKATIRRFDPASEDAPPQFERVETTTLALSERDGSALLDADTGELSLADLQLYIERRDAAGDEVEREKALLHARLCEPITVVVFALLALPLGLRVERARSLATPAIYGVVVVAAFFAVKNTTVTLAAETVIPAVAGAWIPLLAFSAFALVQLWRESR